MVRHTSLQQPKTMGAVASPTARRRAGRTNWRSPKDKSSSALAATATATGLENSPAARSRCHVRSANASAHPPDVSSTPQASNASPPRTSRSHCLSPRPPSGHNERHHLLVRHQGPSPARSSAAPAGNEALAGSRHPASAQQSPLWAAEEWREPLEVAARTLAAPRFPRTLRARTASFTDARQTRSLAVRLLGEGSPRRVTGRPQADRAGPKPVAQYFVPAGPRGPAASIPFRGTDEFRVGLLSESSADRQPSEPPFIRPPTGHADHPMTAYTPIERGSRRWLNCCACRTS
jgi:hypothetical protein